MGTKMRVFGIGIVLFALFWCSVAQMHTVKAAWDDGNTKEVWVDWVNDYHGMAPTLYGSEMDAVRFSDELVKRGWTRTGNYGNDAANPADFSLAYGKGYAAKGSDFAYFSGHANGGLNAARFVFGVKEDGSPPILDDYYVSWYEDVVNGVGWGDYDLEWLTISACAINGPDSNAALTNWGDSIPRGLHIFNGYRTDSWQYWGHWSLGYWSRGQRYAVYLYDSGSENGNLKNAVGYAWQRATIEDAREATAWGAAHHYIDGATVAACVSYYVDGVYIGTDYYFGKDTVQSPLRDPRDNFGGNIEWHGYPAYYCWAVDR